MAKLTRPGSGFNVGAVKVNFNKNAKLAVLKSPRVEAALLDIAEKVADGASAQDGVDYAAWSDHHGLSAHAHATTTDWESIVAQAASNSLASNLTSQRTVH